MNDSETKRHHYDPDEVIRSDGGSGLDFARIVESRLTRRELMKAGLGAVVASSLLGLTGRSEAAPAAAPARFKPITGTLEDRIVVPEGYTHGVVASWGDPIKSFAPPYDANNITAFAQRVQFGYNCDFVGYLPIPYGSENSKHGLLGVNHEYVNPELMFAEGKPGTFTAGQIEAQKAAVGFSVIEVELDTAGQWQVKRDSSFNRRYTADSMFEITGPAAGHDWLRTSYDPQGRAARGTMANCAAGKTPWGTVLSAEENFQDYFSNGKLVTDELKVKSNKRYGIPNEASSYGWDLVDERFSIASEENENYRFGWVVEIDPYDPNWVPKKRTALGRFRHEAATSFVTDKGQVVLYSGDDSRFEYVYKFVCATRYSATDRESNRDLLDTGTLYVAVFNEDGTGEWKPLYFAEGPLTPENGFENQGDVVINARIAADLLGATKMDRPEDIEVNPVNKKVYIACTNNTQRGTSDRPGADKMNPRDENRYGHVVELTEAGNDHAALTFEWELFLVCGDPADETTFYAGYPKDQVVPISCPDNVTFDLEGNLWIATDGQNNTIEINDGVFMVPTEGPERGRLMQFFSGVEGCEVCGPEFTPDNTTLFVAIQHPGEGSTFSEPSTHWPGESGPPRPSVIAIRRQDGGRVGS